MISNKDILVKRLAKLENHVAAMSAYKELIENMLSQKNIYDVNIFRTLVAEEKAILDAYLKRFASIQDLLGAKIFPLLLEISGIGADKMSEVLEKVEKEEIIDSLENWIELREIRNDLEHDYPDELLEALEALKFCVNNYSKLESYYLNSKRFAERYLS